MCNCPRFQICYFYIIYLHWKWKRVPEWQSNDILTQTNGMSDLQYTKLVRPWLVEYIRYEKKKCKIKFNTERDRYYYIHVLKWHNSLYSSKSNSYNNRAFTVCWIRLIPFYNSPIDTIIIIMSIIIIIIIDFFFYQLLQYASRVFDITIKYLDDR